MKLKMTSTKNRGEETWKGQNISNTQLRKDSSTNFSQWWKKSCFI